MNQNKELIKRFYFAFSQKDAKTMQACYHPQAVFSDQAFRYLKGKTIGAMWAMLLARSTDLVVELVSVEATDYEGFARWEAVYTFGLSGRKVHNVIYAKFKFRDGKIIEHLDNFNFWKWSGMAFGWKGWALGWLPFFQKKVSATAMSQLDKFISKNPDYQ